MPYTTPGQISSCALLGATQMQILADDIIAIYGRCMAPNVPFEKVSLTGNASGEMYQWRWNMLHKYITSASEHLGLEYWLRLTHSGGTGTIATDMIIGGVTACSFTLSSGQQEFRGVKDLSFLTNADGRNVAIRFDVKNASRNGGGTAVNTTDIFYLGQLKVSNLGYQSFAAGRFTDGELAQSTLASLQRLRDNIVNLNGFSKRGTAGFRARETTDFRGAYSAPLFDGYLKATRGGALYIVLGFMRTVSNPAVTVYVKVAVNDTPLQAISFSSPVWVGRSSPVVSACTLDMTGISFTVNDDLRVVVTACDNGYKDEHGHSRVRLMYLAEVEKDNVSRSGWVLPGVFTSGSYVLGNTSLPSASSVLLSNLAGDVELLAADTAHGGYGSDGRTSAKPVGNAWAVYRFPVHLAGRQYGSGALYPISREPADGGPYQEIYAVRVGDNGFYRVRGDKAVLKYGPSGSPASETIRGYTNAAQYEAKWLNGISDLAPGMLYHVEIDLSNDEGEPCLDYVEERWA